MADRHAFVADPFTHTLIRSKIRQLLERPEFAPYEGEDLRQEMLLHLWKNRHLYNSDRGPAQVFITVLVTTWIRMEIRSRNRAKRRPGHLAVSLERGHVAGCVTTDLRSLLELQDQARRTLQACPCALDDVDTADVHDWLVGQLPEHDRQLVVFVAAHGISNAAREWTRRTGRPVSRHRVRVMLKRIAARFEESEIFED